MTTREKGIMAVLSNPGYEKRMKDLTEEHTEDGKKVRKFKHGKLNVTVVYHNQLSEKAIKKANEVFNDIANNWVDEQFKKEFKASA
jgi:hypothetical protein